MKNITYSISVLYVFALENLIESLGTIRIIYTSIHILED